MILVLHVDAVHSFIGLDKNFKRKTVNISYPSVLTCLNETVLLSTNNIMFWLRNKKKKKFFGTYSELNAFLLSEIFI